MIYKQTFTEYFFQKMLHEKHAKKRSSKKIEKKHLKKDNT